VKTVIVHLGIGTASLQNAQWISLALRILLVNESTFGTPFQCERDPAISPSGMIAFPGHALGWLPDQRESLTAFQTKISLDRIGEISECHRLLP
jgi:hypothetical protein